MILPMFLTYLSISLILIFVGFLFNARDNRLKWFSLAGSTFLIVLSILTITGGIETATGVEVVENSNGYTSTTQYEKEASLSTGLGSFLLLAGFFSFTKSVALIQEKEEDKVKFFEPTM